MQTAVIVASVVWLAVTLIAVSAVRVSDSIGLTYVIAEAFFGRWTLIAFWALVPIITLGWALREIFRGKIRYAIAWCVLPISAALIFFSGPAVIDNMRFQFNKSAYQRVVGDALAGKCTNNERRFWKVDVDAIDCKAPITIVFIWSGLGSGWNGIVYDAADQIVKPSRERSEFWRDRYVGNLLSCSRVIKALGRHFYFAGGHYTSTNNSCR